MAKIQRVEWTRLRRPGPAEADSRQNYRFAVRVVADGRIPACTELAVQVRGQNGRLTPANVTVVSGRKLGDGFHHICKIVEED